MNDAPVSTCAPGLDNFTFCPMNTHCGVHARLTLRMARAREAMFIDISAAQPAALVGALLKMLRNVRKRDF